MADLPGKAISDFYFKKTKSRLYVQDTFGPKVEMPIKMYFRELDKMPELEKIAIELCEGRTMDVGAGAGSHALELQNFGIDVAALEISPKACAVMEKRGVKKVVCEDVFKYSEEQFDTLLLLMNGIGFCGTLEGFRKFLNHAEMLLKPGGQIIFDSCDVDYMFENSPKPENYYGEITCRYEFENEISNWFKWLYVDKETMMDVAESEGWEAEIIAEDDSFQYLARLQKA